VGVLWHNVAASLTESGLLNNSPATVSTEMESMKTRENQHSTVDDHKNVSEIRRQFLCATGAATLGAAAILGSSLGSSKALANTPSNHSGKVPLVEASKASELKGAVAELKINSSRRLHLINEHLGDDVDVVFYTHGVYINENVSMLNHLMRDRRANIATQMDTTLYNQLFMLRKVLETDKPVHVLSGYRTPETNAKLRRRSSRVAKYSLHMEGRAADIYVPGFSVEQVQKAALSLQAGGVGLYSKSNFVHLDTGQVRHWGA